MIIPSLCSLLSVSPQKHLLLEALDRTSQCFVFRQTWEWECSSCVWWAATRGVEDSGIQSTMATIVHIFNWNQPLGPTKMKLRWSNVTITAIHVVWAGIGLSSLSDMVFYNIILQTLVRICPNGLLARNHHCVYFRTFKPAHVSSHVNGISKS